MTYKIATDRVMWRGKAIKGADAASFEILHASIGRDATHIYFGATSTKADAKSFEILSDGYARDAETVYEILQTKLKSIAKADAKSFQALSATYGKDTKTAFFRGKPIRKCNLDQFRPLHKTYAGDGERFFWTNDPVSAPDGPLDLAKVNIKVLDDYEVNRPGAVLADGKNVYYYSDRGSEWTHVDGADPDTFEIIGERLQHYQRDKNHVYYRGQVIAGADAKSAELLGLHVLRCKTGIWCGHVQLDTPFTASDVTGKQPGTMDSQIDPGSFVSVDDEYYCDKQGVWKCIAWWANNEPPQLEFLAKARPPATAVNETLDAAYAKLFAIVFPVFDAYLPLEMETNELSDVWKKKAPGKGARLPKYTLRYSDGMVESTIGKQTILSAPASAWMSHASALWAHVNKRHDKLILYPQVGYMLPDGDQFHKLALGHTQNEMIDLASALMKSGDTTEAQAIAHHIFYSVRKYGDPDPALIARCAPALLNQSSYNERHHEFSVTTNLAVARHVIATNMLADGDIRVRLEACRQLHGTMADTNQNTYFFAEIIPEVAQRLNEESTGIVREMLLAVIECALVSGYRTNETIAGYTAMEPFIRTQLTHGVNTDLNRARLVEALWALGREDEAIREQEDLLADTGDHKAPPMYTSHYAYRSYHLWILSARLRAASLQHEEGTLPEGRGKELKAERDRLFELYKKPKKWWEFEEIDAMFG